MIMIRACASLVPVPYLAGRPLGLSSAATHAYAWALAAHGGMLPPGNAHAIEFSTNRHHLINYFTALRIVSGAVTAPNAQLITTQGIVLPWSILSLATGLRPARSASLLFDLPST
jgi:hypothetical protein